jgi:hypothetical protein
MSDLTTASSQLSQLAQALPFNGVQAFSAELDTVAQQAAGIVEGTGKDGVVQAIHATKEGITQAMNDQLQKLAASIEETAAAIVR